MSDKSIDTIKADDIPSVDAKTALARLKSGNIAYQRGEFVSDYHAGREARASSQYPFASIVGCADSRVAPELLFNVLPGDLFVVRVAGNIVNDDGLASLEYASEFLNTRLIVVLGHSGCGAVASAIKVLKKGVALPGKLPELIAHIKPSIRDNMLAAMDNDDLKCELHDKMPELLTTAIIDNVNANVTKLRQSAVIGARVAKEEIIVVGALYDIATGEVHFLD